MGVARVLLAILIGVSLLGYGWTQYQNQQADIREAVTVEGTVQGTDVEYVGSSSANNPGGGSYKVTVRYTYTYEGQEYTSGNIYPGPQKDLNEENANALADHYSPGQTTTVYVNREDPSRSFLIEETSDVPLWMMGIGGFIAVGSLFEFGKRILFGGSSG